LEGLRSYHWPGNVRELENVIERAVTLCDTDTIHSHDLSIPLFASAKEKGANASLEHMEREHILNVLRETHGNQSKASQLLGIDRKTLYLKLKKYGVAEFPEK
jgi:transcriptional regulator of acetoin/glycerol metabolism